MKYAESPSNPTGTVYGWVPVEVISEVIAKRGGTNAAGAAVLNALRNGGVFLDRFRE
jgi:aspartate/methionine/tyrosine aminotransferase